MFINFTFKNSRSFYKETYFSLQATPDKEYSWKNTFEINKKLMPKNENVLLKSGIIFGPNASGKSNILKSLAYMKNVILYSASQFPIIDNNEPFALYETSTNEESSYEIEIVQNSTYYRYGFKILNGVITSEWLDRRKERLVSVFKRKGNKLVISGLSKKIASLINVSSKTLFLSIGKNFNLEIQPFLNDVITWFQNLIIVFDHDASILNIFAIDDRGFKNVALDILHNANTGIVDFNIVRLETSKPKTMTEILNYNAQLQNNPACVGQIKFQNESFYNFDIEVTYDIKNKEGDVTGQKRALLFKDAGFNSEGTYRLLCYLSWILVALDKGLVIALDEIDSKLHFVIAEHFLRLFNGIGYNKHEAQLICTAHNVKLMDKDIRRDQIYFTSKDRLGESRLVSLCDFKGVRKEFSHSKRYLCGCYTRMPFLE